MRRLGFAALQSLSAILFAVALLTATELFIGGDVARALLGVKASQQQVAALKHELGLDKAFAPRLIDKGLKLLHGDLGKSYTYRQPVSRLLQDALSQSGKLIVPALIIGAIFGTFVGIATAYVKGNGILVLFAGIVALCLLPTLVVSTLVVYGLGYQFGLVSIDYASAVGVLSLGPTALVALTVLGRYRATQESDYVRSFRALGVPEVMIATRFAFKPVISALVSLLSTLLIYLITATLFVEISFSLPGIGNLLLNATEHLDYPIIMGIVLLSVIAFGFINIIARAALNVLDPRL